jgi:hypothetical protein
MNKLYSFTDVLLIGYSDVTRKGMCKPQQQELPGWWSIEGHSFGAVCWPRVCFRSTGIFKEAN